MVIFSNGDSEIDRLTLTLPVANMVNTDNAKNLENDRNRSKWVLTESTQRELSNEYQHDRV